MKSEKKRLAQSHYKHLKAIGYNVGIKARLIYCRPIDWLLKGVYWESARFEAMDVYVTQAAMALLVPFASFAHDIMGEEIGMSGSDDVKSDAITSLFSDIREFSPEPECFLDWHRFSDSVRVLEACCYFTILCHDERLWSDIYRRYVDAVNPSAPMVSYVEESWNRVNYIRSLSGCIARQIEQFTAWKTQNLLNLGIDVEHKEGGR